MRKLIQRLAIAVAALAGLAFVVWVARRPLFERWILDHAERVIGEALGANAHIGSIEGNWITEFVARDVELDGGAIVQRLSGGVVRVRVAPWALAHGSIAGFCRVTMQAAKLELNLAGAKSKGDAHGEAPMDTAALRAVRRTLRDGAHIEIATARLQTRRGALTSKLTLDVPSRANPNSTDLQIRIDYADTFVRAVLDSDGSVVTDIDTERLADWIRLFVAAPALSVPKTTFSGRLTGSDLTAVHVDADIGGIDLRVRAGHCSLAGDQPWTQRVHGQIQARIGNARSWTKLLPGAWRAYAPTSGNIDSQLGDGVLRIRPSSIQAAGVDIRLVGGTIPLTGPNTKDWETPLHAILELARPKRLPLPPELLWKPTRGRIEATLATRNGKRTLETRIRVGLSGPDGGTASLTGTIDARLDATAVHLEPNLRLAGPLLRYVRSLELSGAARLLDAALVCEPLDLTMGSGGRLRGTGRVVLGAGNRHLDLGTILTTSDFSLIGRGIALGPLTQLAGQGTSITGETDVAVKLRRSAPSSLNMATHLEQDGAFGSMTFVVAARLHESTLRISKLDLRAGESHIDATGSLQGVDLAAIVRNPALVRASRLSCSGRAQVPRLSELGLDRFVPVRLAGALRGSFSVSGTPEHLLPKLDVHLKDVAVWQRGQQLARAVTGRFEVTPKTLLIHQAVGVLANQRYRVAADLARQGTRLQIAKLEISSPDAGSLRLTGHTSIDVLSDTLTTLSSDADVEAVLDQVALGPWLQRFGKHGIGGTVRGKLHWIANGTPRITGALRGSATGLLASPTTFACKLRGDDKALAIPSFQLVAGQTRAEGRGKLLLSLRQAIADPTKILATPIEASASTSEFDLSRLDAASLGLKDLSGSIAANLAVRGTVRQPIPQLHVLLRNAQCRPAGASRIRGIEGDFTVTRQSVRCRSLRGNLAAGPFEASAAFEAPGPLWQAWRDGKLDASIHGRNLLLYRRDGIKIRSDLDWTAHGPPNDIEIRGKTVLHSSRVVGRIPLLDLSSSGGKAVHRGLTLGGLELPQGVRCHLNVNVETSEPIQVRSNVFRGDVVAALTLRGTLKTPTLEGTVSVPKGTLILPGARLRTTNALLRFERGQSRFPKLTVTATGRRHGYDLQMVVRGRYDEPEVQLSSTPPLPAEDLAVLLTTGARPGALAKSGARSVSSFVGRYLVEELADYLFGSESTEAKENFLDRFTVDVGAEVSSSGAESIVVEFRVADNVYLQGERDVFDDVNFGLVYRIRFR